MKTLLTTVICLIACHYFAQISEDEINRLWLTADTNALKTAYEASKQPVHPQKENEGLRIEIMMQQRQFDHEWDMMLFRLIWEDSYHRIKYYYQPR